MFLILVFAVGEGEDDDVFCSCRTKEAVGRQKASAGGPDVVTEDIGGALIYLCLVTQGVGGGGLGEATFAVAADLDRILCADKNGGNMIATKAGKEFRDKQSVI